MRSPAWNLCAPSVSGSTVKRSIIIGALAIGIAAIASRADAQWTGYELALSGSSTVVAGRTTSVRGVAYRVRGIAELVPFGASLRARYAEEEGAHGPWVDLSTDASGAFVLDVPIPENAASSGALELEVGSDADDVREIAVPVNVESPYEVLFRADRRLYEPGEPVHLWALVRDARTGRPARGVACDLRAEGAPIPIVSRTVTTAESGVAQIEFRVAESAPEGYVTASLRIGALSQHSVDLRVGARTWERLAAEVEVEPEEVPPQGRAIVRVDVTTPSGAPVSGASVRVTFESQAFDGTTDADGRASIEVRAPAYLVHETGVVPMEIAIVHPAHGSLNLREPLRLAIPLALEVELVPRHGALVPEIDDVVFARLSDANGDPPPAGTEVTLEGAAIARGRATGRTDANGIAEIPVRLPLGSAAGSDDGTSTTVLVHVPGALERIARMTLPVTPDPELVPSVSQPVLAPGDRVEIVLARRASAASRPVIVELLDGRALIAARRVPARVASVTIDLPPDRVGLFAVRARAVRDDESAEGVGAEDVLIVRPTRPDFVRLEPVRERWTVGERAQVRLHTLPGAPRAFAALLVRDLSAHGGEVPFRSSFLGGAFEQAMLEPNDAASIRLVRAALSASVAADEKPSIAEPVVDELGLPSESEGVTESSAERGTLRDPWPLARELVRRGIGAAMVALEASIEEALASGGLDDLTEGRGAARRFRDEELDDLTTLGEGPVTPSLLTRADPSFTYERAARRVARARLVRLMVMLAHYLDPGEDAAPADRLAAEEPSSRWLPRMIERGVIAASDLEDPWGNRFTLRQARAPLVVISPRATSLELVSPGPDGRAGTRDDVRDPFERVIPAGAPYAVASGEDALMRALAVLSPTERTLAAIAEAYVRTNAEVLEEEIGDAVSARVSEGTIGLGNIGTIGHGGGGGTGSGYGSGSGRFSSRTARAPSIRVGSASVSGLARVVRERFPATLLFQGSIDVDPSGVTTIDIPLADTVTTYTLEAIVWREDGWIWSADARIEVDREIVADAPVPDVARVGDRIRLPLRVSNRGDRARDLVVRLMPEPSLGIEGSTPVPITIAPGGASVVPVMVSPMQVGEGRLVVAVTTPDGVAIDAVRRPMRVVRGARRVHVERDVLASGTGALELDVPEGADPRRGRVRLAVGVGWLPAPSNAIFAAWESRAGVDQAETNGDPAALAFAIGAAWANPEFDDRRLERAIRRITEQLDQPWQEAESQRTGAARVRAYALLGLSPIAGSDRDVADAHALIERLGREVSAEAVSLTDDPEGWAVAAAALAWSARGDEHEDRVAELVRRLERHTVVVGEDRWLATADHPLRSTALLAMAEVSLGHRERAFSLLSTIARWASLGNRIDAEVSALARAATRRMLSGPAPAHVSVTIDGATRRVALTESTAEIDAPELARPGRHTVRVQAGGAPVIVRADADYGVPWTVRPIARGPFAMRYEGRVGRRDTVSELELVVSNRAPRVISQPVVEIELPTGAELTEADRARMGVGARSIERGEGVLTLRLAPLRPGNEVRIPLPLRWSLAGRLVGLGTSGYALDRTDAVTIVPPRTLGIAGGR